MKDEIVLYQFDKLSTHLEVRVGNDTVWLNRQQIALLFDRDIKTIGQHMANVLTEELKGFAVVAKFATTATDGKIYQTEHYNLDMIISLGYRVKSQRGIQFRISTGIPEKQGRVRRFLISFFVFSYKNMFRILNVCQEQSLCGNR